jgi:hypothetical protein
MHSAFHTTWKAGTQFRRKHGKGKISAAKLEDFS